MATIRDVMPLFELYQPESVDDTLRLLDRFGPRAWVLAGGVIYTLGTAVFALERPRLRPGVFGSHALWHLLVIAGSGCHVWAVARYLTPLG